MGKIASTQEVKYLLQISGSSLDPTLEVLIPIVESHIMSYCNLSEASASIETGLKLAVAQFTNFQLQKPSNITSEKIGNYSVNYSAQYPAYMIQSLRPYRKLKFIQDPYYNSWDRNLIEEFEDAQE